MTDTVQVSNVLTFHLELAASHALAKFRLFTHCPHMFLFKSPQVLIVSWLDPIETPFYPNIIRLFVVFVVFFPVKIHGIPPGSSPFKPGTPWHSMAGT